MITSGFILKRAIQFFSKVYVCMAILTSVYLLLSLTIALFFTGAVDRNITTLSIAVFFNFISFVIWYLIFKSLLSLFDVKAQINRDSIKLRKIGRLFYSSFILNLMCFFYETNYLDQPRIDGSKVLFPIYNGSVLEFIFGLSQFFFKSTALFSGFLTPTIAGTACIFLGLFCYALADQNVQESGSV